MQKSTKIKLSLFSTLLLISVGTTVYQINNWSKSYSKIEQKEIQNFDTLWSEIWDTKTNTFNNKLNKHIIQKLDKLAGTPSQQKKLNLAKTSEPLITINNNNSTLTQFIAAANNYYTNEKYDNDYTEQQKINTSIAASIEKLISDINLSIEKLNISNNSIDFDKSLQTPLNLPTIQTSLKWQDLTIFNDNITELNTLIQTQVQENNKKIEQESIIQLKQKLDEFLQTTKKYKDNIQTQYISIKDLKDLLTKIEQIDVSKHQDWFTNLKTYDTTPIETQYSTSFTSKFFTEHPDLQKYQNQLSKITIPVNLTRTISKVIKKSDESKTQTFEYSLNTSISQSDNDLININSLQNIAITISQSQDIKQYVEETPSSTTTSSSDNTNPTTEPTTTNPIPIRGSN